MSTIRGIQRAYEKTNQRGWPNVYWAVDLHDTCLRATYQQYVYEWINPYVKDALLRLAAHPETHLILWSSVAEAEKQHILKFFADAGIRIAGFNNNPHEPGNETSHFNEKFYMSILIDDKAGFDHTEWLEIPDFVDKIRLEYPPKSVAVAEVNVAV